ncbi:MAG: pilin [Candidatus Saccharibacteria bacterium]|nr:pilin [Candidatus Saccharibacteria bacterium]
MKKLFITFAVIMMSALGIVMLPAQKVSAVQDCGGHFLGLPAWYDGLIDADCKVKTPTKDGTGADLRNFIWTIALNIVSMVMGVIGYLAIGFVMYGGIQYMTAQGDPGKVAKGKKTITNSVIGLAITMSASIISGTVVGMITEFKANAGNGAQFFQSVFNKVFVWSGIIAAIMIIYGGIQYVTSTGNPAGVSRAKTTILYSVIGLLVVITASAIVNVVVGAL